LRSGRFRASRRDRVRGGRNAAPPAASEAARGIRSGRPGRRPDGSCPAGLLDAREAARACAKAFLERAHDKATALNNFAWALLTEDQYDDAYTGLALKMSERSNELTKYENWAFLDTLALAKFKSGDAKTAVELEKKAIEHCGGRGKAELEKALAKFEKTLNE